MNCTMHSFGAVVAACGIYYLGNKLGVELNPIYLVAGSVSGGLIPDIDHPKSKMGKMMQPISVLIMAIVGHRTLTHSLLFSIIIGILVGMINLSLGVGIFFGILSHIILDLLTSNTNGVAFLYPFYKKRIRVVKY